jgi:isoquinoline 1-oxidoreductase beta subunit
VKIHRVTAALDCGLVINPDGARMQVEGSVMQGLSAALREQVRLENGRVAQGNFDDYPILRQLEAPERIDVVLRASAAAPTGAGEPALPTVAPALANALFAATGNRYRKLPLNRATLLGEMSPAIPTPA